MRLMTMAEQPRPADHVHLGEASTIFPQIISFVATEAALLASDARDGGDGAMAVHKPRHAGSRLEVFNVLRAVAEQLATSLQLPYE